MFLDMRINNFFLRIEIPIRTENLAKSNIFATFPDVTKFTAKHRIYERICDGIRANGLSFVIGCFAENDSLGPMNFKGIGVRIREKNGFNVRSATRNS